MIVDSLVGLHAMMTHNPDDTIRRVWLMPRRDGKPRWHKLVYHSGPNNEQKCDWIARMPINTMWSIRNLDTSSQYITSLDAAKAMAREQAQHHARYCESAARQGIDINRLAHEGRNEPQPHEWAWVDAYEITRIEEAQRLGVPRLVLFNWPEGNPGTINGNPKAAVDWARWEGVRQAARPADLYGYHGYFGHDGPAAHWPDGTRDLKWPQQGNRILGCPWPEAKWLFTEGGCDNGVNQQEKEAWRSLPPPESSEDQRADLYMDFLTWGDQQLLIDGRVVGWLLFTDDYENNEWWKFDTAVSTISGKLVDHCTAGVNMQDNADPRIARWWHIASYRGIMHNIEPRVVATVLAIESGGQVDAVSSAGAVGLMQVMPQETGFPERPPTSVLLNPDQNVEWGCRILGGELDYFGDMAKALVAYNAGAGFVNDHGIDNAVGRLYLGMFRAAWGELWPGVPCPVGTVPPVVVPPVTPPAVDVDAITRNAAWNALGIALNPASAFYRYAQAHALGRPVTGEFDYAGRRGQAFDKGIVSCVVGQWDAITVTPWLA